MHSADLIPHFDATLVVRLLNQHRELNLRFGELVAESHSDTEVLPIRQVAADAVCDCAGQLRDLRRAEALWLSGHCPAPCCQFDELAQALQEGKPIGIVAQQVATAFAEYRRRNEAEM